jgi:hypothetical protein
MPTDAIILSVAIVAVFVVFGSVLYWGESRTRDEAATFAGEKVRRRSF